MKEKDIIEFMNQFPSQKSSSENSPDSSLSDLWKDLGSSIGTSNEDIEENVRFAEKLSAYQDGLRDAESKLSVVQNTSGSSKIISFSSRLLPAAAVLLLSVFSVVFFQSFQKQQGESAELQKLLALTLINQTTPSQRIDGVVFASNVEHKSPELVKQLVEIVKNDPSTNVRLSAIESLSTEVATNPLLQKELLKAIPLQKSSLVVMNLTNLLMPHVSTSDYPNVLSEIEKSCLDSNRLFQIKRNLSNQI